MQLVRLPNLFTVLADVSAAFLLVAGGPTPLARFVLVVLGGVALYWAGMILNDVFDIEKDKLERPDRPLASGAISLGAAQIAGWGLLVLGVALAGASGYVSGGAGLDAETSMTWLPAAIAVALAVLIVAYDGPLKPTPIAPAAMGGCRLLSFLLGASPVIGMVDGMPVIPRFVLGAAMGFGVYVMGITTMARDEVHGSNLINLRTGFVVMLLGVLLIAFAPGLSTVAERATWAVNPGSRFVILISLIIFPTFLRGFRLQMEPSPAQLGNTIRASILSIIPLAASFALIGAGKYAGLSIFALVVPAIVLAMRLRVT